MMNAPNNTTNKEQAAEDFLRNVNSYTSKFKAILRKFALGVIVISVLVGINTSLSLRSSYVANAKVLSIEKTSSTDSEGKTTYAYKPTFSFRDKTGTEHTAPADMATSWFDFNIGSSVEINYNSDDLSEVRVNSYTSLFFFPAFFTFVGLLLLWFFRENPNLLNQLKRGNTVELGTQDNIVLPKQTTIKYYGHYMQITRQWYSMRGWMLLGMTVFWLSILLFKLKDAQLNFNDGLSGAHMILVLFFLPVIVFVYLGFAYLINKTDVFVSKDTLQIKHHPLPWKGNLRLSVQDLKQLYSKQTIKRSNSGNGSTFSFDVSAISHDGLDVELLHDLADKQQAKFIEREIEKYLGIKDIKVRGEMR